MYYVAVCVFLQLQLIFSLLLLFFLQACSFSVLLDLFIKRFCGSVRSVEYTSGSASPSGLPRNISFLFFFWHSSPRWTLASSKTALHCFRSCYLPLQFHKPIFFSSSSTPVTFTHVFMHVGGSG